MSNEIYNKGDLHFIHLMSSTWSEDKGKFPVEMKRDSLHSGKATRVYNAAKRRKDERLERRSIRQRLIAPVITTNSRPPPSSAGKRRLYSILYCPGVPERIPRR